MPRPPLEVSRSDDSEVHVRHLSFRTDDVDSAHETLVEAGLKVSESPRRRDFARMYTSFLKDSGGFEVQLVKCD
ncbi:MAG: VOC family protein [Dehalococcoidia bacterium]